jgi:hypothetical protein
MMRLRRFTAGKVTKLVGFSVVVLFWYAYTADILLLVGPWRCNLQILLRQEKHVGDDNNACAVIR